MHSFIRKPHTFGCKARIAGISLTGAIAAGLILASGGAAANAAVLTTLEGNIAGGDTATTTVNGITFTTVWSGTAATSFGITSDGILYGWGQNSNGQLGNGTTTNSTVPTPVTVTGALAGKTITQIATGGDGFTVALASDGTVYTWGNNGHGELGNNSTTSSSVPVAVTTSGALSGKKVAQIAVASASVSVLTTDGGIYGWGYNQTDGNGSTSDETVPAAVTMTGVLSGKTVTNLYAGGYVIYALASDGTVFSWGDATTYALGNGSTTGTATTPVAVITSGALSGKKVVQIAGGQRYAIALTSDGGLYAWGNNDFGNLGIGSTTAQSSPVAITLPTAMSGKTISSIVAGGYATYLLTSDGNVFAAGDNSYGQQGNGSSANNTTFAPVYRAGALAGKTVTAVSAQSQGVLLTTSDGGLYGIGRNDIGALANGTTTSTNVATAATLPSVSVKVDGVAATSVTRVSPTSVSFVTPAHAAGTVAVTASAGGNASYNTVATSGASFTYDAVPSVSGTVTDAVVGTAYSATLSAGTGSGTTTWSISSGSLPPGLSLNSTTGVISGTPTTVTSRNPVITATNASGSSSQTYSISTYTTPVLSSASLADAGKGVAYDAFVTNTGGSSATFSVTAGSLPAGLSLNTATGEISGTPTVGGASSFTVKATNAAGTVSKAYSINVQVAAVISTTTLTDPVVGKTYTGKVAAAGSGAISYAVTSGSLPAGLSLDASTGVISGTATSTAAATFKITATNSQGSDVKTYTLNPHQVPAFTDASTNLGDTTTGKAFTGQVTAAGSGTVTYAVTAGALPAGLALDASSGAITGTATAVGAASFTVTASNSYGTASQAYTIDVHAVPSIIATQIGSGTAGSTYAGLITATGEGAVQYTMSAGSIPAGVTLNQTTGQLQGTPKVAGTYVFTITVVNTWGTASQDYTIKIAAAPTKVTAIKLAKPKPVVAGKKVKITIGNLVKGEKYTITIKGKKIATGTATGKTLVKQVKVPKTYKTGKYVLKVTGTKHGTTGASVTLTIKKK